MWRALVLTLVLSCGVAEVVQDRFTNEWVVRVPEGQFVARKIARELAYIFAGQVKGFPDTYVFSKLDQPAIQKRDSSHLTSRLEEDARVVWAEQQTWRRRQKRGNNIEPASAASQWHYSKSPSKLMRQRRADLAVPNIKTTGLFNDELWDHQWYLQDTRTRMELPQLDLRVVPVFARGVTGRGVRVTVLDDGLEHLHEDIKPNYDPEISYDLNDGDPDPTPRYSNSAPNSHGTRCAGEIAMAANNRKCGVGVAYNARIGGIRMLDGDGGAAMDRIEGEALNFALDKVDIYSASWGPTDDGTTVEGPGRLAREALERGAMKGRDGKGAIFVWAAGNGGSSGDDCNCDGYTSSVFTLSVGSASEHGQFPWYGERCASTLISTYSSGAYSDQMIATTDLFNSCTVKHTGTSAAAPLAAGIIALALEVNPALTWRDVQHLVVWTAEVAPLQDNLGWQVNSAGFHTNTRFGFGLMNALALTDTARTWNNVPPWQHVTVYPNKGSNNSILSGNSPLVLKFEVIPCNGTCVDGVVNFLEHVEVKVSIEYPVRGVLEIFLTSPTGTKVQLLNQRPQDTSNQGFKAWSFISVHTWGEIPHGMWVLHIIDSSVSSLLTGWVRDCSLILHGTKQQPKHMKDGPRNYKLTSSTNQASMAQKLAEPSQFLYDTDFIEDQQAIQQEKHTYDNDIEVLALQKNRWIQRWLNNVLGNQL